MSLEQTFPPRGRNCEHEPKDRPPTKTQRQAALRRNGILNLGDPNGPGPTKNKSKNNTPSEHERRRRNITEL
jgi:hypothetical protein